MSYSPFERKINNSLYSVFLKNNYSINNSFDQNRKNILRHSVSYSNLSNPYSPNTNSSPIKYLTKINNLELKLSLLEKTNLNLQNKINENEIIFENRLKQIENIINKNSIN